MYTYYFYACSVRKGVTRAYMYTHAYLYTGKTVCNYIIALLCVYSVYRLLAFFTTDNYGLQRRTIYT